MAIFLGHPVPVTEPDPDDLLLHVEAVGHVLDLLAGRLRVLGHDDKVVCYSKCI